MEESDEREKAGKVWDKVVKIYIMEGDMMKHKRDNIHRGRRAVQDKSKRHDRTKVKESAETESKRGIELKEGI